jgi:hypothetical protein
MTSAINSVHANQPSALESPRYAIGNAGARKSAARAVAATRRVARPTSVVPGRVPASDGPAPAPPPLVPPFEPPEGSPSDAGTDELGLERSLESGGPPLVVGVDPPEPAFGVVVAGVVPPRAVVDVVVDVGLVVVVDAVVTVNVCGVYAVVSDGSASLTHVAVTGAGPGLAFGGTMKVPCQAPFAATGTCTVMASDGAVTATKSLDESVSPGAQPVPLTFTFVPGGPDTGESLNDEGAAWAIPADHHPRASIATTTAATRAQRPPTVARAGRSDVFLVIAHLQDARRHPGWLRSRASAKTGPRIKRLSEKSPAGARLPFTLRARTPIHRKS